MEYRVEELAAAAGIPVDTVRFYQTRGLIAPPQRVGRTAIYGEAHLERLRRIRSLLADGIPLALIKRLLEQESAGGPASLAAALLKAQAGERTYTRAELAREAGIPEPLVQAAQSAGLVEPMRVGGEERFSDADLAMARAGLSILEAGFPLDELLRIAVDHARSVQDIAERSIDLFDRFVRRGGEEEGRSQEITRAFQTLLPTVTQLVALHFQRTLVNRALARLEGRGESEALAEALAAVESGRLEVSWR
jgi:DNA-binding transcriptional MerR regulator